ncbi:2-haloacid dehalogenase [Nocardiopsis sp. Huas11]|uniref:HAD family hydrolase n=1 Tax=Nocardiopsis sp. Huas11 TaxID=2183912 RepID=UPI000EB34A3D|nr:HAD family hydrolase [Nocardiopsis sp. Huas11]RKS07266.1 2-haloacid dehalogenase [Nocardiopsis sp. Huas11]
MTAAPSPASAPRRPAAIAFDVLDTLFPLAPLEWRFRAAGIPRVLMTRWSDHMLRDAFALTLLDGRHTFEDVARGALRDITGHQIAPAAEDAIIEGMAELTARREAADALTAARGAGLRVVTLGNGDDGPTAALMARSGLEALVDGVLSCAAPHSWKPSSTPYLAAAEALEVEPGRLALVTAHGWDVAGGSRAGLVTGWSAQLEGRFPSVFPPPDVSGRDLVEVVDGLLALP